MSGRGVLRPVAAVIGLAGVALAVFGVWGLETEAGRRRFDEMAGMIPWFALLASPVCVLVGAALLAISRRRG